ncbi:MAG TPA: tetratricopeptide repeat protein [Arenibacter sp.]|nr:tetratricopeptide repeat protein [Arenibacter sp.]
MIRVLTVLIFFIVTLGYSQNQQLFDRATTLYNEGKYEEAVESYLHILESGEHSAELYFNLGNTYYKLDSIAPSIYYFEKALLLKPNDKDVLNNLTYARNMTLDAIEPLPQTTLSKIYKGITNYLSFDQWAYLAVVFMVLFVSLYIAFYYSKFSMQKRFAFIGSMMSLILSLAMALLAYLEYGDFTSERPAVVFAEQTSIKSEPNNRSQPVFDLHAGTKVDVLDQLNDWKKIQLSDGKSGWVLSEDIKELKDF